MSTEVTNHDDSMDYFDAMEVIYYDDMIESSETSSTTTAAEDELQEFTASESNINNNDTTKEQSKRKRLRRMAHEQRKKLEMKIKARRKKFKQLMSEPKVVLTRDKLSFVCGLLTIMIIEAVLLVAPNKMGELYTTLLIPLLLARYVIYKSDLYHYFMYDFCYFAQLLLLLQLYKYPNNIELRKVMFSIANGPLCFAIVMWRNSLVFHSMDKMTSMFIHILPSMVTFCQRWSDQLETKEYKLIEDMDGTISSNMYEFYWNPFLYYVIWQTIYLVKTEIISKQKLEYNTDIMTSLRWMTRKKTSSSYKLLSVFGEHNQLPTFVLIQAAYTIATFIICPLLWHSIVLHSLYLALIFIIALSNGATYYFQVFAKRYIEEIGQRAAAQEQK